VNVTAGAIAQSSAKAACSDLVPAHAGLVRVANASATITMDESGVRHEVARIEWLHRSEGLLMVVLPRKVPSMPVPTSTCAAGDGGVRSSRRKPKGPRSARGSQVRGRPGG